MTLFGALPNSAHNDEMLDDGIVISLRACKSIKIHRVIFVVR